MNSRKNVRTDAGEESDDRIEPYDDEEEQALLALIDHRTKQFEKSKSRVLHYTAELEQAERKLEESKNQLSRLRGRHNLLASEEKLKAGMTNVKVEKGSTSPYQIISHSPENQSGSVLEPSHVSVKSSKKSEVHLKGVHSDTVIQNSKGSSQNKTIFRTQIVTPSLNPVTPQSSKSHLVTKTSNGSVSVPIPAHANTVKSSGAKSRKISYEQDSGDIQSKGTKRKFEQKEHEDLIRLIRSSSSARTIHCQTGSIISSQHKRKLRSLISCPTNDQLFATSALDGVVNLWQLQTRGSTANCLSSTDCVSVKQRRWPEDIAWHPHGNSLFSVFSADGQDSQVAVLDLNNRKESTRVNFLEDKPHVKGIINNIMFMPWEDTCFVTGGSDHAVVLWTENKGSSDWKPKALHRNLHSSAVMGVAGLQHKQVVVSAGADKRIVGFNVVARKADYNHQVESKCMNVVPNPCDFNLFMVQTGTVGKQLRLFDYRVRQLEVHAFGWEQETSESQSALIDQAWSPDGLYITSGSADPVIHIFDIRYNAKKPSQSIKAHQKRVFKALWHSTYPLLISISSDLNIGLHKII
ncbi:uncharacterized protein LOC141684844 [Apium graveolens]|uniref:uncharacterized protein LOC141684844 n=1 Tax=Apium graveolens TaxID=4045 RepID=UPI003D78DFA6